MAWLTRTTWATSDPISASDMNNLGLDIRTWGGNVDAAGYELHNVSSITGASSIFTVDSLLKLGTGATVREARFQYTQASAVPTEIGRVSFGRTGLLPNAQIIGSSDDWGGTYSAGELQFWTGDASSAAAKRVTITKAGLVGIAIATPVVSGTGLLHVVGDTVRLTPTSRTPANSAAAGNDGEYCADSSYLYVHTGGSWRRTALATF